MSNNPNMTVPVSLWLDMISLAQETLRNDRERHESNRADTQAVERALQLWRDHMARVDTPSAKPDYIKLPITQAERMAKALKLGGYAHHANNLTNKVSDVT